MSPFTHITLSGKNLVIIGVMFAYRQLVFPIFVIKHRYFLLFFSKNPPINLNMNPLLFLLFLLYFYCPVTILTAQTDPFGVRSSVDAAALSPSELPSFEEYRADPENIKVAGISPKELSSTLKNSRGTCFILDARSEKEYLVSRIHQARPVGFSDFSVERVWMLDRSAQVVVYSASKDRGLLLAQYLKLMGFLDVQLLEGGLIGWKNEGFEVVNDKGKTDKVHVGKKSNTRLLKSGLAVI